MKTTLHRPGGVLLAGALVASVFAYLPTANAVDGTVSGMVTGSGLPLDTGSVQAYVLNGGSWGLYESGNTTTNPDGSYNLSLPPGDYRLGFSDYSGGSIQEFHADAPTVEAGQTFTVGDGEDETIDADLAVASHITGSVRGPGQTLLGENRIGVAAYELVTNPQYTTWEVASYTYADNDGNYDLGGLRAGTYRVGFEDQDDVMAEEFYDDQPSANAAEDITVGPLATVPDIDAELAESSQITGTVTDAANNPMAGVDVYGYVSDGSSWDYALFTASAVTDVNGHYVLDGLAKGAYRVQFDAPSANLYETWNNKGQIENGDDISVAETVAVPDIDAQLVAGEHDPVPFTMTALPTISGTTQVGSTLTATGGSWTPTPETTEYYWFRGQEYTGVNGPTYVTSAADVGQTMSALVQVYGDGRYDFANTGDFGPITAVPVPVPAPVVTSVPAPVLTTVITFPSSMRVKGAPKVGSTLKLKNYKPVVAGVTVTPKMQWFAGSKKIKKATKAKLKVTKALKGKKISVKVTAKVGSTTKTVKVKAGKIR